MNIITVLTAERDRLQGQVDKLNAAISALGSTDGRGSLRRAIRRRRVLSAAGRRRIAAAQRARWAKVKAARKK